MFESFYGLSANPFRLSADEGFRFAHRSYVKAWSYLKYALEQAEGFVLITGRPGTGKTTLIRDIISELDSSSLIAVNLITNQFQSEELLRMVALELGFDAQDYNKATLLTRLNDYAVQEHAEGRRIMIIVDEAQNLTDNGLEELRLISNLQVGNQSLFQVFLIGQEELRSLIYGQGLENIRQRILASCRVEPMDVKQTQGYIEHRLGVVGWDHDPEFNEQLYPLIQQLTHGIPREINHIVGRLLLYGALEEKHQLDEEDFWVVVKELNREQRLGIDIEEQIAAHTVNKDRASPEANNEEDAASKQEEPEIPQTAEVSSTLEDDENLHVEDGRKSVSGQALSDQGEREEDALEKGAIPEDYQPGNESREHHLAYNAEEQAGVHIETTPEPETESESQANNLIESPLLQNAEEERTGVHIETISEPETESENQADDLIESPLVENSEEEQAGVHIETVQEPETDLEPQTEALIEIPSVRNIEVEEQSVDQTELPRIHYEGHEERAEQKQSHLLTDVDDLLDDESGFFARMGRSWRWLFYPVAILVLLIMLLVPKPEDLLVLGKHIWSELMQPIFGTEQVEKIEADSSPQPVEGNKAVGDVKSGEQGGTPQPTPVTERSSPLDNAKPQQMIPQQQAIDAGHIDNVIEAEIVPLSRDTEPQIKLKQSYILFANNEQGELTSQSRSLLTAAVAFLHQQPNTILKLTGVAASEGTPLERVRTALKHAESVAALTIKQGISSERVAIEGIHPDSRDRDKSGSRETGDFTNGWTVTFMVVPGPR
ncbi:MAG: AAA family ATPase [Candidatus Thiodiazotropha sp. (ex Monitilora ramsayi)]|nr:AAA family ATPase [Candidatus Thiodiazotropha sp. (ex Monitilora ramsayi)]